jgi:hypothetical protein
MIITYKTVNKVQFPVFLLNSSNWSAIDGILFLDDKILDDKNQSGNTLGARRVQTAYKNLFLLKYMVVSHNGLLKQSTRYFIDNKGMPFIYEKTKFAKLHYLKIKKVQLKETAVLICVKGYNASFTAPRPPTVGYDWAGILHLNGLPWMLYEFSETKLKDTRKKV